MPIIYSLGGSFFSLFALLLTWSSGIAPAPALPQDIGYSINLTYSGTTTVPPGHSTAAFNADFLHATDKPSNGSMVNLYVDNRVSYEGTVHPMSATED